MTDVAVRGLTKRFGQTCAVDRLSFDVASGRVTGFLGPNGAGKTTTLRILLGLVRASSGEALIGGRRYVDLAQPRRVVGAVLEAGGFHPGRRGRDHLRIVARSGGIAEQRVDQVLDQVGLIEAAGRRVGGYSLGMRQRLGLAAALLGDPEVLVLDEPANGLDPEGVAWLRGLLRGLAGDGRTVLVSSHALSEVAQTVDEVVIISAGQVRFSGSLDRLAGAGVSVRTPDAGRLLEVLRRNGHRAEPEGEATLVVHGAGAETVGRLAAAEGVILTGLTESGPSLEAAFLHLTSGTGASGTGAAVVAPARERS